MTISPAVVNQVVEVSYVYCGEGYSFENCTGNPVSVNYVGNFNRQNQNNPYSNTYNLGWRQNPNFSWSNQNQPAAALVARRNRHNHQDFTKQIKGKWTQTIINLVHLKFCLRNTSWKMKQLSKAKL